MIREKMQVLTLHLFRTTGLVSMELSNWRSGEQRQRVWHKEFKSLNLILTLFLCLDLGILLIQCASYFLLRTRAL